MNAADFRKSEHATGIRIVQQASINTATLLAGESYRLSEAFFLLCVDGSEDSKGGSTTSSSSSSEESDAEFSRSNSAISGSSLLSSSSPEDSEELDSLSSSSSSCLLGPAGGGWTLLVTALTTIRVAVCISPRVSNRWKYGSGGGGFGRRLRCIVHMSLHTIYRLRIWLNSTNVRSDGLTSNSGGKFQRLIRATICFRRSSCRH